MILQFCPWCFTVASVGEKPTSGPCSKCNQPSCRVRLVIAGPVLTELIQWVAADPALVDCVLDQVRFTTPPVLPGRRAKHAK